MTTVAATDRHKGVRVIGLLTIIAGIVLVVAGAVTWGAITTQLAAEHITVSDDAAAFAGQDVNNPWTAYAQANVINKHALEATGGKTYAELGQDDPLRQTAMTASFLRASLFTSVVAYGVAALVVGLGIMMFLIGWALRKLGAPLATTAATTPAYTSTVPASPVPTAPAPGTPTV